MRSFRQFLASLFALAVLVAGAGGTASAFDHKRSESPEGWGRERTVRHWVYHPRYHHVYHSHGATDPYAYRYEPRGYYPYYNSAYWVPRHQMKGRTRYAMRLPGYASSWGYPLACKIHGRKSCGVPFKSPPGDPRHYYDRY